MAARSMKPTSILASTCGCLGSPSSPWSSRPNSPSSLQSEVEDSLLASLALEHPRPADAADAAGYAIVDADEHPVGNPPPRKMVMIEETHSRKRSQPIPIEAPQSWKRQAYTPLSARGDLIGGYFPYHGQVAHHYRQPFTSTHHNLGTKGYYQSNPELNSPTDFTMSNVSSTLSTPALEATAQTTADSSFTYISTIPELLLVPRGKYHPSNYKSASNASASTPAITAASSSVSLVAPLPPTNLSLPHSSTKRQRPAHQRKTSDIKRKLQQYQQNMMAQARVAAASSSSSSAASSSLRLHIKEPISPRLCPAGSSGPITPLELEESATAGYILGGTRVPGGSLIGGGIERERERLMRKLLEEENRRGRGGVSPPIASV